ncbi:hypothetical protein [Ruegeria conchae]|uniref:hypothetical protein n=1 Tax=Ruegeria conchae TaxID=981384 RepID=UPI000310D0BC|nr:hypothetical protein [Ruegeria conchae]
MYPRRKIQNGKSKCQKPSRQPLVSPVGISEITDLWTGCIYVTRDAVDVFGSTDFAFKKFWSAKSAAPENSLGDWIAISDAPSTAEVVSVRYMG